MLQRLNTNIKTESRHAFYGGGGEEGEGGVHLLEGFQRSESSCITNENGGFC